MASGSGNKLFKPGEVVQKAGIYRILHQAHREPHEATLNAGELFPVCRQCGVNVRFQFLLELNESE